MGRRKGLDLGKLGRDNVVGAGIVDNGRDDVASGRGTEPQKKQPSVRPIRRNQPRSRDDDDERSVVRPGEF